MFERPIREMSGAAIAEPLDVACAEGERRGSHRFACRRAAEMMIDGVAYDVQCRDISYGGMCVIAPPVVQAHTGQSVTITARGEAGVFIDQFHIAAVEDGAQGKIIHLSL